MIELWTAIGMAVCDCDFNEKLTEIAKVREKDEALKQLLPILREYGFRMSCYEALDFLRFIRTPRLLKKALAMHDEYWYIKDKPPECLMHHMNAALALGYEHPYVVFDNELGKNIIGVVDPMTGEPLNNVPVPPARRPVGGQPPPPVPEPRFVKLKPPIKEAKPKKPTP